MWHCNATCIYKWCDYAMLKGWCWTLYPGVFDIWLDHPISFLTENWKKINYISYILWYKMVGIQCRSHHGWCSFSRYINVYFPKSAVHYHCLPSLPYMTEVNFKAAIPQFYPNYIKMDSVYITNIVLWYSRNTACTEMLEIKQQEKAVYNISSKTCSPHQAPENILFHIEIKYPLIKTNY